MTDPAARPSAKERAKARRRLRAQATASWLPLFLPGSYKDVVGYNEDGTPTEPLSGSYSVLMWKAAASGRPFRHAAHEVFREMAEKDPLVQEGLAILKAHGGFEPNKMECDLTPEQLAEVVASGRLGRP